MMISITQEPDPDLQGGGVDVGHLQVRVILLLLQRELQQRGLALVRGVLQPGDGGAGEERGPPLLLPGWLPLQYQQGDDWGPPQ